MSERDTHGAARGDGRPGGARITGIATRLPGAPHAQAGIAERMAVLHGMDARAARRLRAFHRRTRIARRHSVLDHDWTRADGEAFFRPGAPPSTAARMDVFAREAPRLVEAAARDLFAPPAHPAHPRAPRPEEIDHVIVVSCTGFVAPGLDVMLTRRLGLRPDVGRTLVGFQGCQAGLTALRLAEAIATSDPTRSVLIVAVELSTLHFQYEPTDANLTANALFADGAAAVLVDGCDVVRAPGVRLRIEETATHLLPEGEADMRWCVGDHGFTLTLSDRLPRLLERYAPMLLGPPSTAEGAGGIWAVHPGGSAILDAVQRGLGLEGPALDVARAALRDHGNLSSATIFFVLERVMRHLAAGAVGVAAPGAGGETPITALAFGPGLTIETARLGAHVHREDDEPCTRGPISPHAAARES